MSFTPHVLISGGSSGIGKAIAKQYATNGYNVTIIARDPQKLASAVSEIKQCTRSAQQQIVMYPADVSNKDQANQAVAQAINTLGTPDVVVTSAGIAVPGYFHELPLENFERTMQTNFFGTLYIIKAVTPAMIAAKKGHISIISSGAALSGIYGYTSYGASKFALRGFAEALRCEMKPHGIYVSIAYPPDTDTPQLQEENKTKPKETKAISNKAKIMTADDVATSIIKGIQKNKFAITPNFEIKALTFLHSIINPLLFKYFDKIVEKTNRTHYE